MNLDPRFFHAPAPERAALELADLPTHPIPLAADDAGARPGPQALRPGRLRALRAAARAAGAAPRRAAPGRGAAAGRADRPATLERALALQARPERTARWAASSTDIGALSELRLRITLAEWQGVRVIDPHELQPDASVLAAVPRALAERDGVPPLLMDGDALVVLVADPGTMRCSTSCASPRSGASVR